MYLTIFSINCAPVIVSTQYITKFDNNNAIEAINIGILPIIYKKPSKFRQFINWIVNKFAIFKSKCQAEDLIEGNKDMAEELSKEIAELKRIKGCLEFDLTCGGIINFGSIMRELDEVNAKLKKLEKTYENEEKVKCL